MNLLIICCEDAPAEESYVLGEAAAEDRTAS
jgi:hypothetical protein